MEARGQARELARGQLQLEAELLADTGGPALQVLESELGRSADEANAVQAGQSMASAWVTASLGAAAAWRLTSASDGGKLPGLLSVVPKQLKAKVETHAATQALHAYHQETHLFWKPYEARAELGLVRVWSSILDKYTCPSCSALDGKHVDRGMRQPPLHPRCRCMILTIAIRKFLAKTGPKREELQAALADHMQRADIVNRKLVTGKLKRTAGKKASASKAVSSGVLATPEQLNTSMFDTARVRNKLIRDTIPRRDGTYLIRTSAMASVEHTNFVEGREQSIREGIKRGVKFAPVKLVRRSSGADEIADGNHRLRVARQRSEPFVLVTVAEGF